MYKQAADAFLKGYKTFRTGQKAPDSLLKLGMTLARLGQKDSACSAFTALDGEFPNASTQIKRIAQSERERTGC
jgi:TolA-binding protein